MCRNLGDSGKLRFYELSQESKMRVLKTHSHTSHRLAMEPGTREEKQLKGTQTLQQGKSSIKNLPRAAGVAGGGRKGSRTCRIPPVWRGGAGKALRQTTEKSTTARRALVDMEGNTGANTREESCEKKPRGPSARRGVRRANDKYPGWKVATPTAPLGGEVFNITPLEPPNPYLYSIFKQFFPSS